MLLFRSFFAVHSSFLLLFLMTGEGFSIAPASPKQPFPSVPHLQKPLFSRSLLELQLLAASQEEPETAKGKQQQQPRQNDPTKSDESIRRGLRRLAQLSLEDYDWRRAVFQEKEADRKLEESLARMMGEDASYVRPMDASDNKIGPLVSARAIIGLRPLSSTAWFYLLS
jgi:hypothetical protein